MTDPAAAMTTIFTEFYFFLTIVLMFFIHIGFCMYEVGVARTKNVQHTLLKNAMTIPVVGFAFFLFGMWLYIAPQGWPVSIDLAQLLDRLRALVRQARART